MKLMGTISSILIIAACTSVPPTINTVNVDPIATEIQAHYNSLSAYESSILSYDNGVMSLGLFGAVKPNRYKEVMQWENNRPLPRIEVCNGNERKLFTPESLQILTDTYDCALKVNDHFFVLDKVKRLSNYENTIREIIISNDDYKDRIGFAGPGSSIDPPYRTLASSDTGYWIYERNQEGETFPNGTGYPGVEVVFKDENNNDIRLVFSKDNYQLIKSEIIFENGGIKLRTTWIFVSMKFDANGHALVGISSEFILISPKVHRRMR